MDRTSLLTLPNVDRRTLLIGTGAVAAALGLGSRQRFATAQQPADELLPFGANSYAFVSSGYISYFVVTSEGVIATDPSSQFDALRVERLKAAIESVTDQPVRYLIYSHDHADHSTGGALFAETATFVSHVNAVAKIEALNDANTPVPTIAFDDFLSLELGGTTLELYHVGPNHSDNSVVMLQPDDRVLFAVDFIPVNGVLFQTLPDFDPEGTIASLTWIEENLDFDTLIPGHPPVPGTKATVGEVRGYVVALMAAVRAAQDEGLADNSPEMVESVRAALEPDYGDWNNFAEWLPLNIEGLLRIWSEESATPTA
jgi:glyoxylase-like metal-dependent hydrolase (beta-lactamase superfamily II)